MDNLLDILSNLITDNYLIAPILSLVAGLLTSFTPCSLSGVPLIIGYVGGTGSDNPKKALKLSLIFALGSAIVFTSLGVVASLFGKMVSFAGSWWYLFLSLLLLLVVLQLWGIVNIIPQNNLLMKNKKKGYAGALIAGLIAGLFSSPCSTPVLIALLAIVSAQGSLFYGILLLLLYSIGHSILVVIAGTSIGFVIKVQESKRYENVNRITKIVFGVLIIALAMYMFYLGIG